MLLKNDTRVGIAFLVLAPEESLSDIDPHIWFFYQLP